MSQQLDQNNKAGRFKKALNAWGNMWATGSGMLWGMLAVTGGYNLGYTIWTLFNRRVVDQMIAQGSSLLPNLLSLIIWIGVGILSVLVVWMGKVYWGMRDGTDLEARWIKDARLLSVLNLLIPLMYMYWKWRNHWAYNSVAAVITALATGLVAMYCFSRLSVSRRIALWFQNRFSPTGLVVVVALVFFIGMGCIDMVRHWSFNSGALDLGMMDQLVWNTSQGRFLQGTFIGGKSENFLGHHFSPILALLAPLYWVVPFPETLVIIQVAAIAFSTILLYFLAVRLTRLRWFSACLSLSLLLNPFLHEGTLFDFHQDALGMVLLSFGLLCVVYEQWGWASVGWVLSLLCKEEIAVYWMAFGVFMFFRDKQRGRLFLTFALANAVWLIVIVYVVIPAFQETGGSFTFFRRYIDLGGTPDRLLTTFLTNPVYVLKTLLVPTRIGGVGVLALSTVILWWRASPHIGILLVPLAISFLSSLDQQYSFTIHYSMLPLAMLYTASAYAARDQYVEKQQSNTISFSPSQVGMFAIVSSAVLFVWLSPLGLRAPETLSRFRIDDHDHIGRQVVQMIIPSASVVAQNTLAPHLAHREHITLFPCLLEEEPDYYVLDVSGHLYPLSPREYHKKVTQIINNSDYGPIYVEDGYIVLQKGAERNRVAESLEMLQTFGPIIPE